MSAIELQRATRTANKLRPATVAAVRTIAAMVETAQHRLRPRDVQRKGVGDFVTKVDVRCERLLRTALTRLLPAAGFLGEESDPTAIDRDWVWVVDPIDGTSNFSRGLPHFAVAVALLFRGRPLLACVHCFPDDATLVAVHGRGAFRNGRRLRMSAGRFDDGAIVGCQWHRGQQQLAFLARLQAGGARIRTLGSTVTQLADVVLGRLDANVQEQGRIWDIAAPGLLVVEAGGKFTDWQGRSVFPLRDLTIGHTPTVGAPAGVHRRVLRALAHG
jgi:myo-inositol-1(or 4)-monophosphatase